MLAAISLDPLPSQAKGADASDEIVVTSRRSDQALARHQGNVALLGRELVEAVSHQHIHELLTRASGVWVSRGSGQEHLTAIRSPVLSGAGSCGNFLYLEDGIPTRPAGFCNVNQLFEINTEQADSIEVIRGPGNALYGSNALHGTINVLMPEPDRRFQPYLSIEAGANRYRRLRAASQFGPESRYLAAAVFSDDGGFREESGYRQGKAHLKARSRILDGDFTVALSLSDLDQETAGFIFGEDAYKNPSLNRRNLNPEAFRNASSQRLYGIWSGSLAGLEVDIRPYLRHSDMEFLQHFLPGQPLEENGHHSAGVLVATTLNGDSHRTIFGVDTEWNDSFLRQTQAAPTQGSPFLVETRPVGKHYDYDVTGISLAAYGQTEFDIHERLTLGAGLRVEYIHYDYDNRMSTGNNRDDGSACGFGGCLYTRPADRSDNFTNLAPKLSASFRLDRTMAIFASLTTGFRAPQVTELYRLQNGQEVADLDSERIESIELGLRMLNDGWTAEVAAYAMKKHDSILRDAEGFNISSARSKHHGVEVTTDWLLHPDWSLSADLTYASHRYDFDQVAARGETFINGNDVDTAPRLLGSIELVYDGRWMQIGAQWTGVGDYYLDAENRFRYPGHSLVNLRADFKLSQQLDLSARLNNVGDRAYADRADYAFGNYRYFPGRGRELFLELRYRFENTYSND